MKKLLLPVLIALFLVSLATAQEATVDTVLLASTENFADAELAKASSYNEGTPILLTEKASLSADTKASLVDLKPTTVVVVGGPEVISDAVVSELETEGYAVVRVWGTTATGTAAELATYSNPEGTDSATLVVEDSVDDPNSETGEVLAEVTAQTEGDPILLVSSDGVPAVTADALTELGVEEVTVVGDLSADAQTKLEADLGELKLKIKEKVLGKKAEIRARLKAKFEARLNASDTLLVVAAANFKHRLAAPVLVGHGVFHVGEEAQIQEVVDLVNAKGIKEVKVVGNPELGAKIEAALKASTQAEVDLHTGEAAKAVSELVKEKKEKIKEKFKERKEKLKERRDAAKAKMKEKATALWERLNNLETKPEGVEALLAEAKNLLDADKPVEAWVKLRLAVHLVKKSNFEALKDKVDELREEIKKERENLKARVDALKEFNREFSDKLKDLSVEEKLKTIKELHLLRIERVKAVVEAASGNETRVEKIREIRKEGTEKLRDRATKIRGRIGNMVDKVEGRNSDDSADA